MHEPTYDEVLLSGYTAGYESGYTDGQEECGHDYSRDYFTIEALEDGQLNVYISCEYSINDGEWETFEEPATLSLSEGDKVRFRGYLEGADGMFSGNTIMSMVYGNIESLAYGDNFVGEDACLYSRKMFNGYGGLEDASNLVLPATTLANSCYREMFSGCTNLTTAPELPATTLASYCYDLMFYGCTSLTSAPELPSTTLATSCYQQMFEGCTRLTTAPALPATTLAHACYLHMFNGCTNLTTAPELPATTLAVSCYAYMFYGCTSIKTAPELPATTLANYCYNSMFAGCTSLTTAPELPATTLVEYCYTSLFSDCPHINEITCLATNPTLTPLSSWLRNVSPTGTFIKAHGVEWPTGASGIPTGWTVEEAE